MKHVTKVLTLLVLSVLCLGIFAACGSGTADDPTPTYTAFHDYLEGKGSEQQYKNLIDPKLGKINVTFRSMKSAIDASIFYSDAYTTYYLSFFFDRDQNEPVSVYYSETSGTSGPKITVSGDSTDLSSVNPFTVSKVERELSGEKKELSATDDLYAAAVSAAKEAVRGTISWITAELQVCLDSTTVTVQDLYAQS